MKTVDMDKMRAACRSAAATLATAGNCIKAGMTTADIDRIVHNDTIRRGGKPAPLNYKGFPRSCCTSVNDVICHGIPGPYVLKEGDIIDVDVTTILDGHFGDCNATFEVGAVEPEVHAFVTHACMAMWAGIHAVKPGIRLGEIGRAIEAYATKHGYSVVRDFGGHGIGTVFHSKPHVHHFANNDGPILKPGDIFTVEPMLNMGDHRCKLDMGDGWTARTVDGSLSAQFENTVLVTEDGVEVLTVFEHDDVQCQKCGCWSWVEGSDPRKWGWVQGAADKWTCRKCLEQAPNV